MQEHKYYTLIQALACHSGLTFPWFILKFVMHFMPPWFSPLCSYILNSLPNHDCLEKFHFFSVSHFLALATPSLDLGRINFLLLCASIPICAFIIVFILILLPLFLHLSFHPQTRSSLSARFCSNRLTIPMMTKCYTQSSGFKCIALE